MRSRRRLLVAVFAAFALALLAGTLVPMGVLSAQSHRDGYLAQRLRETEAVADSLVARVPADQTRVMRDRYLPGGYTVAWLLDGQLRTVAEPRLRTAFPGDPGAAPEIRRALDGRDSYRFAPSSAGSRLFIALPVVDRGTIRNVLWISSSTRPVTDLDRRTWALLGGIGFAGLLAAVAIGFALAARLSRRLEALAAGAGRFAEGNLGEPIAVRGRDEVAALATRLNDMAASLKEAMDREKQFVSAASHQIRTPLTSIRLRLEAIADRLERSDHDTREYLGEMIGEIDRLTDLTSKLLAAGGRRNRLGDPVAVPLGDALAAAVARVEPIARNRGVRIDMPPANPGATLRTIPGAFEEVLLNILDNAVKFSPAGGTVTVSHRTKDDSAVISVSDEGPGISQSERDRVFEPFYSSRHREGGHGLGLTISAQLCELSGATLRLDPGEPAGATAVVEWPLVTS